MVHVEIFLGGETGFETIGSRFQKGFIQIFPSYQFDSKLWTLKQYHFCSLDPWLEGICQSSCPDHPWINPKPIGTGGKSIFDEEEDEEEAAGEENEEEENEERQQQQKIRSVLMSEGAEDEADMIGGGDGDDDDDDLPPSVSNPSKPFLKKGSSRGPVIGRPRTLSLTLSFAHDSFSSLRGQREASSSGQPHPTHQYFSTKTKSSQSQSKYGLPSKAPKRALRERTKGGECQINESSPPSSHVLCGRWEWLEVHQDSAGQERLATVTIRIHFLYTLHNEMGREEIADRLLLSP
jgi:hypothetical protein